MPFRTIVFAVVLALAAPAAAGQKLQFVNPDGLSTPQTYTHVVRAGNTVYIAGQVGNANGKLVGPGMREQFEQVLKNLQTALASQGAGFEHVAKINIYVTDMAAFRTPEVAAVRSQYFGQNRPASTLVQVAALATPDFKIEIEAIAVLP